jgi:hypothetical protein
MSLPDVLFKGVPRRYTRGYTLEVIQATKPQRVVIPCVGAYALATTAVEAGISPENIEACDISLYSTVIGNMLAGTPFQLRAVGRWEWLNKYMTDPVGQVAAVVVAIRMLQYEGGKAPGKLNLYRRERIRELVERQEVYIDQARAAAERLKVRLGGLRFQAEDMWELLARHVPNPAAPEGERLPDGAEPGSTLLLVNPPRYNCLAPHERILTADLRWVPCGTLRVGDEILAFDENLPATRRRRWRFATITHSEPMKQECVRVHMEDGTSVVCTMDHPWLADPYSYTGGFRDWIRADQMEGKYALRALDTWKADRSYEAGWLAGMYDGEGCLNLRGDSTSLSIAQVAGPVSDEVENLLRSKGFRVGGYDGGRGRSTRSIEVRGGFAEQLRALGVFRPGRLLANLRSRWHDRRGCEVRRKVRVERVEPIGMHPIQSISTSCRTYVGEGFLMHNSGYDKMYQGVDEAFEWVQPNVRQFTEDQYAPLMRYLGQAEAPHALLYYATPVESGEDPAEEWGVPWKSVFAARPKTGKQAAINWIVANRVPEKANERKLQRSDIEGNPRAKFKLFREGVITADSRLVVVPESREVASYYRDLFVHNLGHLNAERYKVLLLDGKLVATIGLHLQNLRAGGSMQGVAKLRFAFSVDHPDYDRLHKLTLSSIISSWFWEDEISDIEPAPRAVQTTMLTPHPEVKTARGIFKLKAREKDADTGWNKITYYADVVDRTPRQTLEVFLSRWAAKSR